MTATASGPIHLGTYPAAPNRIAIDEEAVRGDDTIVTRARAVTSSRPVPGAERDEDMNLSSSIWSWTTLSDGVMLLGIVWMIPVAMLVIGTPVALALAFLLRLVRLALGAF